MGTKDGEIEFRCIKDHCGSLIPFSVKEIERSKKLTCPACHNDYVFNEELIAKIRKFDTLIRAVKDAEDILGSTNVGITVRGHEVLVPYRLMLTRLSTLLTLKIGSEELLFHFRVEPLKEREYTSLK